MFRSLYTSATGMMAQQLNIDIISNNLANVNTSAFKKARVDFQDLLYASMAEPAAMGAMGIQSPIGAQVGMGVRSVATQKNFTIGSIQQTNNPLDIAINGDGFFEVTLPDGTKAYSRDGALRLDGEGNLTNASGYTLGIKIPKDAEHIEIKEDGTIMVTRPNVKDPVKVGEMKLARFLNPAGLKAIGGNLYLETPSSGAKTVGKPGTNGLGSLLAGHLEKSNVNVVEEMINIIQAQRAYEINAKGIQASDEMMRLTNQLQKG